MEAGQAVEHDTGYYTPLVPEGQLWGGEGEGAGEDLLQVCRICLGADCKLYELTEPLCDVYETLMGLTWSAEPALPRCVCRACSGRLRLAARLRAAGRRAHAVLEAALQRHGRITMGSIQSASARGPLHSDLEQEASEHVLDSGADIKEEINLSLHDIHEEDPVDVIKTELIIGEVVDEESTGVAIDISSLQDDITVELMRAEHDDESDDIGDETGDGAGGALWMTGLHAVEVKNEDLFDDGVGGEFDCDDKDGITAVDRDSSGHDLLQDQMRRRGRKRRTEETEAGLNPDVLSGDGRSYKAKTVAALMNDIKSHAAYSCETSAEQRLARRSEGSSAKKSYSCDVCKKLFTIKSNLRNHMRIHTGEKPYSCSECDKSFGRSDHLKLHSNIHSGEKPHACDVCDKSFRTKNILRQHLKLHSGEKSYSCELCNRMFVRKGNLQSHLRTHSGEKPYSCEVCNKTFSLQCNLKHHLRKYCNG